jgi:hypothetical protein
MEIDGGPAGRVFAAMPVTDAACLVQHMAGRFRLPDALRRADALARTGQIAAGIRPSSSR